MMDKLVLKVALLFILGGVLGQATVHAASLILPVQAMKSSYALWCWATTDAMVINYSGGLPNAWRTGVGVASYRASGGANYTLCTIGAGGYPPPACQTTGPCTIFKTTARKPYFNRSVPDTIPFSWVSLVHQLDDGNPVEWIYRVSDGTNHAVLIVGYDDAGQILYINDPATGGVRSELYATFYSNRTAVSYDLKR